MRTGHPLYREPRLLVLALALVVVAGLSAGATLVRQEDPRITPRLVVVTTLFPGANAERVESLVTEPIEAELEAIPAIEKLSSVSRANVSVVTVELDQTLMETAPAFAKVRDAVGDARLPVGAAEPTIDDDRLGAYTLITGLVWTRDEAPPRDHLARHAERLQQRLRALPGTEAVTTYGAPDEEMQVLVDAEAAAAAGWSAAAVAARVAAADPRTASGTLRPTGRDLGITVAGALDAEARVAAIPLEARPDGGSLTVGDVAEVRRAALDPPRSAAIVGGRPGVLIAARIAPGVRVDAWTELARAELESVSAALPRGLALETVFDQSGYTEARLDGLARDLAAGAGLVILILLLTLGWRSALLVGATLPLATLVAFAVLKRLDIPIHQISVTGLIVALGLLVDNAIVVVDAVRARLKGGAEPGIAVSGAIRALWAPLLASTGTTVLAFMPIVLLPGNVGEFVSSIGISVVVSLVASYVLAVAVTGPLAARFLKRSAPAAHGEAGALERAFERSVEAALRRPVRAMVLASALPLTGFALMPTLTQQFFPPGDRDQLSVEIDLGPGIALGETRRVVARADARITAHEAVRRTHWVLGRSAPPFYYNLIEGRDGQPGYAQAQVDAVEPDAVRQLALDLQRDLDDHLPGARVLVRELLQGPPVPAPIEMRIYGDDPAILRAVGAQYRLRMASVPGVTHSEATLGPGLAELVLDADEETAARAGLPLRGVAHRLAARLQGVPGGQVLEGTTELPIRVRVDGPERTDTAQLEGARLLAGPGAAPPLDALGDLRLEPAEDAIPHRDGVRVNIVRGYLAAGLLPDDALRALRRQLEAQPVEVPAGYRVETGGDAEKRGEAVGDLLSSVAPLTVLMVASLVVVFGSFRLAGLIGVVAAQAAGLGLLSLWLGGFPFGFQSIIGLLGLVGVAINAAIIIASALRAHPRAIQGDVPTIRAVVVEETSRHIISTTLTTFAGFLPLMLGSGEFWPPFATTIAGGVLLSALVSFYFVPPAFRWLTLRRPLPVRDLSSPAGQSAPGAPILEGA